LHAAVIEHIDEQLDGDIGTAQELTTTDHGHGREEQRTYLQLPAPEGLPGKAEWKGLKSVGVVTSRRKEGEEESIEVRYYLSSLPVDLNLFARAVRGHWSVENACHWTLDVTSARTTRGSASGCSGRTSPGFTASPSRSSSNTPTVA
jgi:Transposase